MSACWAADVMRLGCTSLLCFEPLLTLLHVLAKDAPDPHPACSSQQHAEIRWPAKLCSCLLGVDKHRVRTICGAHRPRNTWQAQLADSDVAHQCLLAGWKLPQFKICNLSRQCNTSLSHQITCLMEQIPASCAQCYHCQWSIVG